ncbi:MAG: U32 family peptidase [Alphaproteobacteria bacterium]
MTKTILTLGPCLFNWKLDDWKDFYFKIADESDFEEVYLGEVICSRRLPFYEDEINMIAERLTQSGKKVIRSTLALIMNKYEEDALELVSKNSDYVVEANDVSALLYLEGKEHYIGPFVSIYNEGAAEYMFKQGAKRICLPYELSKENIAEIVKATSAEIEIQAFGRLPLAVSSRCYHARSRGLRKSKCQYVCNEDYDGMDVQTLELQPFLNVNGTCTMSHSYVNLTAECHQLMDMGVQALRLSPQDCDMIKVNQIWRKLINKQINAAEADALLLENTPNIVYSNGFYHGYEGREFLSADYLE